MISCSAAFGSFRRNPVVRQCNDSFTSLARTLCLLLLLEVRPLKFRPHVSRDTELGHSLLNIFSSFFSFSLFFLIDVFEGFSFPVARESFIGTKYWNINRLQEFPPSYPVNRRDQGNVIFGAAVKWLELERMGF